MLMTWLVACNFGSGFNGGETAPPHLYMRLFTDYATHHKMNFALLFIDVLIAFATLSRRIIFDTDQGGEHWFRSLRSTGYADSDVSAIRQFVIIIHLSPPTPK